MKFHRKNKGFTLIETLIVVGIIAILVGIIGVNTGLQQEKAGVEQAAAKIRDYFLEAGAIASKNQQQIRIGLNANNRLTAVYNLTGTDVQFENRRIGAENSNQLDISSYGLDNISNFSYNNLNLFNAPNPDGSLSLNQAGDNNNNIIISPIGPITTTGNADGDHVYMILKKGHYFALIHPISTGNVDIYISKGNPRSENGNDPAFEYYPAK